MAPSSAGRRAVIATLIAVLPAGLLLAGSPTSFKVGDETVQAWLARPAASGPTTPGIVVIHEWWGLNQQIKGVADRLAKAGYVAIAPDLYRGKQPADAGLAHEMMRGLSENRAVGIIKGAVAHLRSIDKAGSRSVGTIGFCMGGRLALATGLRGAPVQATVMFYGSVETEEDAIEPLRSPLLGIFGAADRGIPVEDVRKFEAALKAANKKATIIVYPAAGHAFFNEDRAAYDRDAAEDSWNRTVEFLAETIGKGPVGAESLKKPGVPDLPPGAAPNDPGSPPSQKPPAAAPAPSPKPPAAAPAPSPGRAR
jgi:carboxymethylenebutenolidase